MLNQNLPWKDLSMSVIGRLDDTGQENFLVGALLQHQPCIELMWLRRGHRALQSRGVAIR